MLFGVRAGTGTGTLRFEDCLFDFELRDDDEVSAGLLNATLVHCDEYVHVAHSEFAEPFVDCCRLEHFIHLLPVFVGLVRISYMHEFAGGGFGV